MTEKLQKVLADRGIGSRREMERWIAAGRISVNARVAQIGDRVEPNGEILVDGRKLDRPTAVTTRVLVLNKRAGVIVSRKDPEQRPSVFDELPRLRTGRWISVGRLDLQTSGLLLLTNDGALANKLTHPATGIDREYAVRVNSRLDADGLTRLQSGVTLNGKAESFSDIRYYDGRGTNHWYHVVLMEGRNREVRELFASQGVVVTRLKRVRYGPVVLPPWLPRGALQEMSARDLAVLRNLVGLQPPPRDHRRTNRPPPGRTMLIPYPALPSRKTG